MTAVARARRVGRRGLDRFVPPSRRGWRWVGHESPADHLARRGLSPDRVRVVHPPTRSSHPLPIGVRAVGDLPADAGWWGFSMADVPTREVGATRLITLPDARVVWFGGPGDDEEFHPAVLGAGGTAVALPQTRFRERHAEVLRSGPPVHRLARATWVLERVWHNHSHWLTAHLPKLVMLRDRGELDAVVLPEHVPAPVEASLRRFGVDGVRRVPLGSEGLLQVDELTVVESDRFGPRLLRRVRAELGESPAPPSRRVFISRAGADRRRLVGEAELAPILAAHGFEAVRLEDRSFDEQVDLLHETSVLCGPHGAGLTNMLFAPEGAEVVEIADPAFPNPNFYAESSALGHRHRFVPARMVGEGRPVDRDLVVDPVTLERALGAIGG